ncbi:MAG: hypothetical protein JWO30_1845 [Fibrobacteres bacterium]|nr:hypothetical protein [Fibrobacterota bacterium]
MVIEVIFPSFAANFISGTEHECMGKKQTSLMRRLSHHNKWLRHLCRVGVASLSLVYLLIGLLTAMAALGLGGKKIDQSGLFPFLYRQPLGRFSLCILASGILAYVFWRVTQAVTDPAGYGKGPKGICMRASFLFSAGLYGSLAVQAFRIVWEGHPRHAPENIPLVVGALLLQPHGRDLVRAAALIILTVGFVQFYRAITERFRRQIPDRETNRKHAVLIRWSGRFGFAGRGVVLSIIAWLFLNAAKHANPREAGGIARAWDFLEKEPLGAVLLAMVACSLATYGVFLGVKAFGLQDDLIG